MKNENDHLKAIEDIKLLMHKSSRFIGLSGWSGIAAGICALAAAVFTGFKVECWRQGNCDFEQLAYAASPNLSATLIFIALVTFIIAFTLAFFFTFLRSRKTGTPIWGLTARKVMINLSVPMLVGGLMIWRLMEFGFYGLVAPACLLFYGLGLINAAKFTLPEIRYLGYFQLVLGIVNLWMIGYGLYFWAAGFGLLHIFYGIFMWHKYERDNKEEVV